MLEKFVAIIEDEAFREKLFEMDASEAVVALKEKGLDITEKEFVEILKQVVEPSELSENDLDFVAGGAKLQDYIDTAAGLWNGFKTECKKSWSKIKERVGKLL